MRVAEEELWMGRVSAEERFLSLHCRGRIERGAVT